jgi:hypothetical protein
LLMPFELLLGNQSFRSVVLLIPFELSLSFSILLLFIPVSLFYFFLSS